MASNISSPKRESQGHKSSASPYVLGQIQESGSKTNKDVALVKLSAHNDAMKKKIVQLTLALQQSLSWNQKTHEQLVGQQKQVEGEGTSAPNEEVANNDIQQLQEQINQSSKQMETIEEQLKGMKGQPSSSELKSSFKPSQIHSSQRSRDLVGLQSSAGGGDNNNRIGTLHNLIREKDKEIQGYQQMIQRLKKDNYKYTDQNSKRDQMGAEQIERMMSKNQELERQNEELKVEIMTLKRIKNGQGKALQKMTFENNYPQKIKNLVDELKWSKERIKELDEETQRQNKVCTQVQIQNSGLQNQLREFRNKLNKKYQSNVKFQHVGETSTNADGQELRNEFGVYVQNVNASENQSMVEISEVATQNQILTNALRPVSTMVDASQDLPQLKNTEQEMIDYLEKQISIMKKSKESTLKKNEYKISKLQKKIEKMLKESEQQFQIIQEKDKEIKLQQIKLREFLQRNMKELPLKTFDEIEDIIDPVSKGQRQNADIYGLKQTVPNSGRRMADTYKRVREIAHKQNLDGKNNYLDSMINQYVSVKPQYLNSHTRQKSQLRPKKLEALSIDVSRNQGSGNGNYASVLKKHDGQNSSVIQMNKQQPLALSVKSSSMNNSPKKIITIDKQPYTISSLTEIKEDSTNKVQKETATALADVGLSDVEMPVINNELIEDEVQNELKYALLDHSLGAPITAGPEKYALPKAVSKGASFADTFAKTNPYERSNQTHTQYTLHNNQELVRGTLQLIYDEQAQLAHSTFHSQLTKSNNRELFVEDTIYPNTDVEQILGVSPTGEAEANLEQKAKAEIENQIINVELMENAELEQKQSSESIVKEIFKNCDFSDDKKISREDAKQILLGEMFKNDDTALEFDNGNFDKWFLDNDEREDGQLSMQEAIKFVDKYLQTNTK